MNIIAALLIFTVIVVIHELGHFIFAKKNGVGVPEFSIGMGPRLITMAKTKNGMKVKFLCSQKAYETDEEWGDVTKYSWKLLPLGGSCAMVGEDEDVYSEDSFNTKGKWARFTIIFAGPFFNFLLAFVLSIIIIAQSGIDVPKVFLAYENQPAKTAGIMEGDLIKSINGHKITIGRELETYVQLYPLDGSDVTLIVERDGNEKTFTFSPKYKTNLFGFSYTADETRSTTISAVSEGKPFEKAGIKAGDEIISVNGETVANGAELKKAMEKYNTGGDVTFQIKRANTQKEYTVSPEPYETNTLGIIAEAREKTGNAFVILKYSVIEVKYWIVTTLASLKQLITGALSVKNLSGPVGIVNTVGDVIEQTSKEGIWIVVLNMLYMSVLLSANLGVMNLLPIPALDGGRILFIIVEAIRRKPIDKEKEGYVHFAGFALLMILMVFVMYNDIVKLLH